MIKFIANHPVTITPQVNRLYTVKNTPCLLSFKTLYKKMSSQFSQKIYSVYNKYKEITTQRANDRMDITTIFFNENIQKNVEDVLYHNAASGKKWGYVYTFPTKSYISRDSDALELVNISPFWHKGSFHVFEIIKGDHFTHLKCALEQHLSDDTTAVRIYYADEIDNEGLYSGFWAEWYPISPFEAVAHHPFDY